VANVLNQRGHAEGVDLFSLLLAAEAGLVSCTPDDDLGGASPWRGHRVLLASTPRGKSPRIHGCHWFRSLNLLQLVPRHRRHPAGSVLRGTHLSICSGQTRCESGGNRVQTCSPGLRARPDPTVTSQQFAMPVSQQMLHGHCQVLHRLVTALYFFASVARIFSDAICDLSLSIT